MNTRTRVSLGMGALLGLGLLVADVAPAAAAPPPHARAHGYYRNSPASRDFDRDGIPDHRDRDIDNDGVLNSRDRDDYSRRTWSSRSNYRRDFDRDGVRNWRDRDRDNDGVRNRYDRNDYNRHRR